LRWPVAFYGLTTAVLLQNGGKKAKTDAAVPLRERTVNTCNSNTITCSQFQQSDDIFTDILCSQGWEALLAEPGCGAKSSPAVGASNQEVHGARDLVTMEQPDDDVLVIDGGSNSEGSDSEDSDEESDSEDEIPLAEMKQNADQRKAKVQADIVQWKKKAVEMAAKHGADNQSDVKRVTGARNRWVDARRNYPNAGLVPWDELFSVGIDDIQGWDAQIALLVRHIRKVQGPKGASLKEKDLEHPDRLYPPDTVAGHVNAVQHMLRQRAVSYNAGKINPGDRIATPFLYDSGKFPLLDTALNQVFERAQEHGKGTGERDKARALSRSQLAVGFTDVGGALSEEHPDGLSKKSGVQLSMSGNLRNQDLKALRIQDIRFYSRVNVPVDREDLDVMEPRTFWRWFQSRKNKNLKRTTTKNKKKKARSPVGPCCEPDPDKQCRVEMRNEVDQRWEPVAGEYDLAGVLADSGPSGKF